MSDLGKLAPGKLDLILRRLQAKRGPVAADRIEPRPPGSAPLPLSFSQQRLWFLDRLHPGGAAYNVPTVLHLAGHLGSPAVAALEAALREIARRHEALRTVFPMEDGEPRQAVTSALPALAVLDLSALPDERPDERRRQEAEQWTAGEVRRPFDLTAGPLLRVSLLRLGSDEHLLVAVQHHILSDAWSKGILMRELAALYAAFSEGRPSPLPELPVQYADFAIWQRRQLSGERLAAEIAFWRERLLDAPPELPLPADRPHPAVRTERGVERLVRLPAAASAALRALAQRSEATPFMVLLAAFQALLARITAETDVSVGTPVAGRHRREAEGLIGLFVNTLVLRTRLGGDPTFAELVARVREVTLDAYAHQEVPFEKLVEELAPERRLDRTPFFRVLFTFQNTPATALELPGLKLELREAGSRTAKLDLTLTLQEEADGVSGWLAMNADLFDEPTAARLAAAFERLTAAAVESPDRRLSELPLLSAAESHAVRVEWTGVSEGALAPDACLSDLFTAQSARTPEAVALVADSDGAQFLTYRELADRARALAGQLRKMGVGPDVVVGLCAERSPELAVGVLGVLEAGGAYLPLDPSYPRERLELLLEDSGAAVLLAQKRVLANLPAHRARTVLLDGADTAPSAPRGSPWPSPRASPDDLAYVIYTSGSTGRPKGVGVPHRGAVNRLLQAQRVFRLGAGDAVLQKASIGFDFSVWEILAPLIAGARLVLARPGGHREPAYLARLIAARGITIAHFVPSMLEAFLDQEESAACTSLRQVFVGGEALSPALRDRFFARLGCALENEYGPTEATIDATWGALLPGDEGPVSIGRPIPGCTVYILDAAGAPLPLGAPGELFLGGVCLARGYLGRPDLTAERFVPGFGPGDRLYRTGDLARWWPDGRIELLGRADQQVKIRGFRIEPGEVETALRSCPGIGEAAVLVVEEGGGRRLAAFLVPAGIGEKPDVRELRRLLEAKLPAFLVPSRFTFLDALPLNPHGKLDRRALSAMGGEEREETGDDVARTPVEELLAQLWCELLGVEKIGRQDGFFDLGGHSLLGVRLVSRIRETFGIDLEVRTVFEAPTLADLAAAVAERLGGEPAERLGRQAREGDLPLSFAQERLWFLDQLGDAGAYAIPAAFRVRGALDPHSLHRALAEVVRRHEALRTTFGHRDGRPYQVIDPVPSVLLPRIDLSGLPPGQQEAEVSRRLAEESRRPFDLARGPLLRALLLRLGAEDHAVSLVLHHIVSDGWSAGVLVRELSALYASEAPPLPELPVQYADYALWQRRTLDGERLAALLADGRRRLDGMPALALPGDRPRPALESFRGARCAIEMPAGTAEALRALGRGERVTLFMTLLAAWQALLGRYSGQDDFPVGTPVANRGRGEVQDLIGFFVNTLVLRADLAGDPPFRELLQRVRETALAAYAREELPFERLVEELRPERDLGRNPLFQVLFTLQEDSPAALRLGALELEPVDLGGETAKLDLTLVCRSDPGGELQASLEVSTDLFDAATGARMLEHFAQLLAAAAVDPGRRLSRLDLLGEAERRQLLAEIDGWNQTASGYPRDATIHQLFEEQARLTPDRIALIDRNREITYAELDARAGRLARRLRLLGAGLETPVGAAFERTAEMIVAFLAALKVGGAYVPLDPSEPAGRLAAMIREIAMPVILTESRLAIDFPPGPKILALDREPEGGELDTEGFVEPAATGLAYVMFTSGSTGRPKAVGVEHRGVVRLVRDTGYARLGSDEVFLQLAHPCFDVSTFEIWGALLNGGRLVLYPGLVPTLAELGGLLERRRVTSLWLTAGLFHHVVEGAGGIEALRPVSQLVAGGDILDPGAFRKVQETLPGCTVINGYGPTENTTFTCCWTADGPLAPGASVPIGTPISNTTAYVVDRWLELVPAGVPGELVTGGDGVARGYLGRPDLTAERFVPDPFAGEANPGARLYRTGDRVRLPAGRTDLEFLGRVDRQVKIRGFRLELEEVEAALRACAGVREAAVSVLGDGGSGRRIAAFVVREEGTLNARELRRLLGTTLPLFMVPSRFTFLETLPLNSRGKVDRGALARIAALAAPEDPGEATDGAPGTPVEELLAQLWSDLLKADRVSRHDSFFDLGGHSLLTVRLIARVRETFGIDLAVRTVFETPTLAGLAAAITERLGGEPAERLVRQPRDGEIPLSFAQERLWFLDQLGAAGAYVIPAVFRLRGALDARMLRLALAEIVRRHETLRTTFGHRDGRPYQVVAPAASVPLPVVDLSGLEAERKEQEAVRQLVEETRRPFDLERGPLLRALLLRLGEEDAAVSLVLHHIVSDGWSAGVLVRELSALCSPGSPPLPELPVQYADYALWQRRTLAEERLAALLDGWRGRLAGMPALELPADRPRPAFESFRGARYALDIPAETAASLRALGRGERVTLFMTLLAAWQALLGRYSGQDDFPVGTPVANRGQGEVQGLIGFFVNSLVMRAGLAGDPPFRELLRRVRETALAAYGHEELPFEKLVEELRAEGDLRDRRDRHALFQVLFTLQEDGPGALRGLRLGGLALEPIRLGSATSKLDLTLVCQGTEDGGLRASLEISTDLFDPATGTRMLDHFAHLLRAVADDPGRRLSDLEILGEAERRQILALGGRAEPEGAREVPIHRLFEEQARLHPDRVALVDRDRLLTYGELADRAGRFARHLRGLGVGTDALVGVALERSAEMVIACLGILAAGGAYVPLDPAEPRERLEAMVEEVGLRWLFSSSAELLSFTAGEGLEEDEPPVGLAYVMFTSGSTGRPKAVGVEHRGVVRLVRETGYIRFGPEEVFLQLAPPAFDAATLEIWGPLLNGGRLVLFPGRVPSVAELGESLARHQVTTLWLTAGLFHQVVSNGIEALRPVSQLLAGGDVLDPDAVRKAREALPQCTLVNGYGPTENTTFTCCWTSSMLPPGSSVPIGRPIDGTRVHVLDRSLRPVPIGVPGELLAGGDGLARGYLGRPDLTAERFVPDPFAGDAGLPGARLYRTGDRVRMRGDGTLEILGRLDQQVKIRGFRVEPGEIEAVLAGHPEVSQAAVVVAEGRGGGKVLAAYVVSQAAIGRTCVDEGPAGREAFATELRRFLRRRLPEPMVPAVVVLDSLPLNANGKVDRAVLSRRGDADAPGIARMQGLGIVPPRSPIEEEIAGLWASVLGVEPIGVHDDFFELGGHSLLGIQLLSRVRDAFGVDLGVQALFAAPTVAELAEALVGRLVELADDEVAAAALEELMELEPATAPQGR